MKEIEKIVSAYNQIDFKERKAALATVVRVQGSAYRRAGARMIMTDDGRWTGAISGGCLEGDALRRARQIINAGKPEVVRYDTMEDQSATSLGVGLGCNGIIDVLIEPITENDYLHHIDLLKSFLSKPRPERGVELIATVFSSENENVKIGERLFQKTDNQITNYVSDADLSSQILALLPKIKQEGKSQSHTLILQEGQKVEVFIEILKPAIHLVLFGAGYDSIPLVKMAHEIGWYITLVDDCVAHLQPKRFPEANEMLEIHRDAVSQKLKFDGHTAAVLISHNYKFDLAVLKELLKTEVPYVGIFGPKKRFDKMLDEIGNLDYNQMQTIHSPIGLDIGAETPEEIAISILAEIQARFTKRKGGFLKTRDGSIHERD